MSHYERAYLQTPGLVMDIVKQGIALGWKDAEGEDVAAVIDYKVVGPKDGEGNAELSWEPTNRQREDVPDRI